MDCLWKTWRYHEQQPTTSTKEEGIKSVHLPRANIQHRDLAPYKGTRTKTEECNDNNKEENAQRDRKRAILIREQTKVEVILLTIKNKRWYWEGHIMCRSDNSLTKRVTEWLPRNSKRSQGRQMIMRCTVWYLGSITNILTSIRSPSHDPTHLI